MGRPRAKVLKCLIETIFKSRTKVEKAFSKAKERFFKLISLS